MVLMLGVKTVRKNTLGSLLGSYNFLSNPSETLALQNWWYVFVLSFTIIF